MKHYIESSFFFLNFAINEAYFEYIYNRKALTDLYSNLTIPRGNHKRGHFRRINFRERGHKNHPAQKKNKNITLKKIILIRLIIIMSWRNEKTKMIFYIY